MPYNLHKSQLKILNAIKHRPRRVCGGGGVLYFNKNFAKTIDFFREIAYNRIKESLKTQECKERVDFMNLARVSSNGQITVPIDIGGN